MSANKHTPGPWVQVSVTGGWDGVAEAANRKSHICALKLNNPANARLIAAAPELLEALSAKVNDAEQRVFEDWLGSNSPSGDHEQVQRQWLESSDYWDFVADWHYQIAAIAKATGGAA